MLLPREGRKRRFGVRRTLVAVALALVAHGLFVVALLLLSQVHFGDREPFKRPARPTSIALRPIDASRWTENRGEVPKDLPKTAAHTPAQEKKKEEKKPEASPKGQVVDVAPGNNQAPSESDYLAESNNTVKKETHAKEQTPFYRNAMPQRTSPKPVEEKGNDPVEKAQRAGNMGEADDDRPLAQGHAEGSVEVPRQKARSEVAMRDTQPGPGLSVTNREENAEVKGNSNRLRLSPGELAPGAVPEPGSRGKFGEAPLNLLPSTSVLNSLAGAAPNDDLQSVDEGEGTFLNTREWKYASFFNRLKQSIGYTWNPTEQIRLRDPTGQIYWGKDRDTLLRVTLDGQGRLKDVFVEKGSGLDFLDVEAMKAFERAQPFPNPPPGMVEADGTIRFAFGFKVILTNTPGVQLFRGAN